MPLAREGREAREKMEAAARHKLVGGPGEARERKPHTPYQFRKKLYDRIRIPVRTLDVIIWVIVGLIVAAVVVGVIIGPG